MTKEQRIEQRRQWREQEYRDIEAAKAEMAREYGLTRNAKFDRAWEIAWSYGHSSGINEVKGYFGELADLIQPDEPERAAGVDLKPREQDDARSTTVAISGGTGNEPPKHP